MHMGHPVLSLYGLTAHIDEVLVLERRWRLLVLGRHCAPLVDRTQVAPRGDLLEGLQLLTELLLVLVLVQGRDSLDI